MTRDDLRIAELIIVQTLESLIDDRFMRLPDERKGLLLDVLTAEYTHPDRFALLGNAVAWLLARELARWVESRRAIENAATAGDSSPPAALH